jgi:diacylglycerol kinase (ATP)
MPESVVLLANPAAGAGRGGRLAGRAARLLESGGLQVDLVTSRGPGHLAELAAAEAARGRARVVAAGGDGTLSEVVAGLLSAGATDTALGILPLGTGNDFVKSTGLPRRWREACSHLLRRFEPRRIDAGRVNGRWFLNTVGFGFDAAIARETLRYKWLPGPLGYAAGMLSALRAGAAGPSCTLRWQGGEDRRRITLVAACNGQYAGGLFRLAPEAALDDGFLDLVWADAMGRGQALACAPRVMRGTHGALAVVRQARSAWLEVESEAPMPAQADGELLGEALLRLRVELSAGVLTLWS